MVKQKKVQNSKQGFSKQPQIGMAESSDTKTVIWVFDQPDLDGKFAFQLSQISDRDLRLIIDKMMQYERMTWMEIMAQTHDKKGHSKHHALEADGMSEEAQARIRKLHLEEDSDVIFSFALTNMLRIIGIRDGRLFHVKWYDPEHRFYPSKK